MPTRNRGPNRLACNGCGGRGPRGGGGTALSGGHRRSPGRTLGQTHQNARFIAWERVLCRHGGCYARLRTEAPAERPAEPRATSRQPARAWVLLPILGIGVLPVAAEPTDADCLECHGDPEFSTVLDDGTEVDLSIDPATLAASVHAGFSCTDCHGGTDELPHDTPLPAVDCALCHDEEGADYEASIHARARARGAKDAPSCSDCHGTHDIRSRADPESRIDPLNVAATCARCHADPRIVKTYGIPVSDPLAAYRKSVHGAALVSERDFRAATCSSCHRAHRILPMDDPESSIFWRNVPETCGACHRTIYEQYRESVHGKAARNGVRGVPVCIDCHGEHAVRSPRDPAAPVHPLRVSRDTCGRCHGSELIAGAFGLPLDRVRTFERSYHGLAIQGGSVTAANCASCHGIHAILPSSDPRSTVHPANLRRTCGTCHDPDATGFARGPVHLASSTLPGRIVRFVRNAYITLIALVIGAMLLHNGADLARKARMRSEPGTPR